MKVQQSTNHLNSIRGTSKSDSFRFQTIRKQSYIILSVYEDSLLDLEKDFHEPIHKHSADEDLAEPNHWFDKLEDEMESGKINLLNWIFK